MKIGFVDHHLNNFHANKFLELLRGPLAGLGATVTAAWESDPTGEDWCAKHDVPRANSAAAVAELGWSPPARRNWADFSKRLTALEARYPLVGLKAARPAPERGHGPRRPADRPRRRRDRAARPTPG